MQFYSSKSFKLIKKQCAMFQMSSVKMYHKAMYGGAQIPQTVWFLSEKVPPEYFQIRNVKGKGKGMFLYSAVSGP